MVISEEIQKKYGFLLQPIKDLTKNWEVDVTNVLEEYLEELEKMSFSFDNGTAVLNFAEASLLIQGTACVWSRKVEYLYVLVRQTLDMIANKQKESGNKNTDDANNDTTEDPNFDDEDEKLLKLDDITIISKRQLAATYDPITPIPIIPPAMLENDADERGRVIHSENDSVCYTNDYWENRFLPFENKMSVLDRESGGLLDHIIIPSLEELENAPLNVFSQPSCNVHPESTEQNNSTIDNGGLESIDEGGAHDNESPFVENMEKDQTVVERMHLRPRFADVNPVDISPSDKPLPSSLDPYIDCTLPIWLSKDFHKFKSFRIPASLVKKTRKRKHSSPSPKKVESISTFLSKRRCLLEVNPLQKFVEQEQRRRKQLWRQQKKVIAPVGTADAGLPGGEIGQDAVFEDNAIEATDCDVSMHSDTFSPDLDDLIDDVMVNQRQDIEPGLQNDGDSPTSYEDLVRHHVEMFYSAARRFKEETALAQRVKHWDEAITPKLAEQDIRPEFDIHKYGGMILKKFTKPQESRSFKDIVESSDTWFICRLFAATLQLVNDNNFLISKEEDFSKSVNTMKLTLLSQHRLCERFDDYSTES